MKNTTEWAARMALIFFGSALGYLTPWALVLPLIGATWAYLDARKPKEADNKELAELRTKVESLSKQHTDLQAKLFGVLNRGRTGGMG